MKDDSNTPGNRPSAEEPSPTFRLTRETARGMAVAEFSRAALIRLIDFPELPLRSEGCETVKIGRSSLVVKAEFPFGAGRISVAYKRMRRKNWWKAMTGSFRSHRASRAWRLGRALIKREVDTPRPIAVVVPRKRKVRADAFLATEWIEGAVPLSEFLRRAEFFGSAERRQMVSSAAESLGRLLGRMHTKGIRHRDLKPSNLLVVETENSLRTLLIDLDGASLSWRVSRVIRCRNLSRLVIGTTPDSAVTHTMRLRFLRAYLSSSGVDAGEWKRFWRNLERVTEIRHARKNRRSAA
jgi:tRNA A-37 threonylcarbamoyl transferase component Bud32